MRSNVEYSRMQDTMRLILYSSLLYCQIIETIHLISNSILIRWLANSLIILLCIWTWTFRLWYTQIEVDSSRLEGFSTPETHISRLSVPKAIKPERVIVWIQTSIFPPNVLNVFQMRFESAWRSAIQPVNCHISNTFSIFHRAQIVNKSSIWPYPNAFAINNQKNIS